MKTIKIKIAKDGTMEAETFGMKGKACLKYLEAIEKMTDGVVSDSEFTKEYLETEEEVMTDQTQEVRE